nr:hypothetical protein [Klebsiella pneumoniae]
MTISALMRQRRDFAAILSGRAMENPVAVFNTLIDALARTELHPIMVDADANDLLVDLQNWR